VGTLKKLTATQLIFADMLRVILLHRAKNVESRRDSTYALK